MTATPSLPVPDNRLKTARWIHQVPNRDGCCRWPSAQESSVTVCTPNPRAEMPNLSLGAATGPQHRRGLVTTRL